MSKKQTVLSMIDHPSVTVEWLAPFALDPDVEISTKARSRIESIGDSK